MFDNKIDRFEDKDDGNEEKRILKIRSQEIESKFRLDVNKFKNGWKFSYGVMAQYVKFNNAIFNRISKEIQDSVGNVVRPELLFDYDANLNFFKYGAFAQVSKRFFDERLSLSFGLRNDMNSFTNDGNNPLATLSPRLSVSYALTEKWNLNASVGTYYKIPPYTILGFQDSTSTFVNRDAKYIRSDHYVIGTEFLPNQSLRFTLEGFVKNYSNYPVSLINGISLANQGGGFDVLGNEPIVSSGKGQVFGFEFYAQQKLVKNYFAVLSYTFYNSRFSGLDGELKPSAWDYRHLFSALLGRKFNKGWEVGLKYRFAGGAPFTPFDPVASQLNFPTSGVGVLDFSQLNTERLINFNQFDIRVDKKINFKRRNNRVYREKNQNQRQELNKFVIKKN
jgi:outer membrane receptor for ferrienterochelin and colicin